jgi:hypothetical protein
LANSFGFRLFSDFAYTVDIEEFAARKSMSAYYRIFKSAELGKLGNRMQIAPKKKVRGDAGLIRPYSI